MFSVASTYCILTTKFVCIDTQTVYMHKPKICYKMIFRPEHAEVISVHLLNQLFESVSDLFVKEYPQI